MQKSISINLILGGLFLLSILFIDRPFSVFISTNLTSLNPFFFNFTLIFDKLSYYIFWILLVNGTLGVFLLLTKKTKKVGFVLLTVVFTHIAASVVTNIMKSEFKRARPEMYLKGNEQTTDFYNEQTKDYSFPSAHTSFYLSLFLPFALHYRQYILLLLFIPSVIIIGRVIQNEHYVSDVVCSVILVFNLCLLAYNLLGWADNRLSKARPPSLMQ